MSLVHSWCDQELTPGDICKLGGCGYFLPIFRDEYSWSGDLRIVLYLVGLLWCFLGVAIIADLFMQAIETITSKEKIMYVDLDGGKKRQFHVKVWNDTVANLTLMALGSSAPEIMLSVIEIIGGNFYAGELGPSTIVGSAAFNLLVITAICVYAIPDGQSRTIKDVQVFYITAASSVFAYLWLVIILTMISPNMVEWWEALITFLLFPALVFFAFKADQGAFNRIAPTSNEQVVDIKDFKNTRLTPSEVGKLVKKMKKMKGDISDEEISRFVTFQVHSNQEKSRAYYRVQATRQMTGGKQLAKPSRMSKHPSLASLQRIAFAPEDENSKAAEAIIEFDSLEHSVTEKEGKIVVTVKRLGSLGASSSVQYNTNDITATAWKDYKPVSGILEWDFGEINKEIPIEIVDDDEYEPKETFSVTLTDPQGARLGDNATTTITIISEDLDSVLSFEEEHVQVMEDCGDAIVTVKRSGGCAGTVSCRYYTVDGTAVAPADYKHAEGTVTFMPGELKKNIHIQIVDDDFFEQNEYFKVIICDIEGGAKFDATTDGMDEKCISTVTIISDDDVRSAVDNVISVLNINMDKFKLGGNSWGQQFRDALKPGGDGEDGSSPGIMGWFMHFATVPFKLIFAFVPPTSFANGWACFFVALVFIALVTMVIGDMAALLGCALNVEGSITAITFVALGTSLPDTFASKAAAVADQYADASIGNVTGSNSVNVYLGLGLPWLIAAIYWQAIGSSDDVATGCTSAGKCTWTTKYSGLPNHDEIIKQFPNGVFIVDAGDLGFSVGIFIGCAVTCIATILWRRKGECELGGPKGPKTVHAIFFGFLWLFYIAMSILKTKKYI